MIRVAHIENNQIVSVTIESDNWVPLNESQMLESEAISENIPYKIYQQTPDDVYNATINAGYTTSEGYTFAMGDQDRINWDQYAAHHERKLERNQITPQDNVPMVDIYGNVKMVSVERMLNIVVEIGDAFQAAFFTRALSNNNP